MSHDDHDDGLVHSHNWGAPPAQPTREQVAAAMNAHPAQSEHDDGLDHGHGWACGERGQPGHG